MNPLSDLDELRAATTVLWVHTATTEAGLVRILDRPIDLWAARGGRSGSGRVRRVRRVDGRSESGGMRSRRVACRRRRGRGPRGRQRPCADADVCRPVTPRGGGHASGQGLRGRDRKAPGLMMTGPADRGGVAPPPEANRSVSAERNARSRRTAARTGGLESSRSPEYQRGPWSWNWTG